MVFLLALALRSGSQPDTPTRNGSLVQERCTGGFHGGLGIRSANPATTNSQTRAKESHHGELSLPSELAMNPWLRLTPLQAVQLVVGPIQHPQSFNQKVKGLKIQPNSHKRSCAFFWLNNLGQPLNPDCRLIYQRSVNPVNPVT